jgi:hypothetical protein
MEDTTPLPIVDDSGTAAAPTTSSFQQNLIFESMGPVCVGCSAWRCRRRHASGLVNVEEVT